MHVLLIPDHGSCIQLYVHVPILDPIIRLSFMKIITAEFIKSATRPEHYPPAGLPEIAFAGRSNVGKSSLINTLVNRKRLAKTSSTPGRTQLINFFNINEALLFVDIPGYGYARVPAAVKRKWGPMIETYLTKREVLKGVVLILDIRREPRVEEDNLVAWLNRYHIQVVYVLTKSDKLKRSKLAARQKAVADSLGVSEDATILFSAKTRTGRDAVWSAIQALVETTPAGQASDGPGG